MSETRDNGAPKPDALATTISQQYESGRANAELDQPFTVEWLCHIGFDRSTCFGITKCRIGHLVYCETVGWSYGWPVKITTRREVLKWLDVLGIDVATTKGGAT